MLTKHSYEAFDYFSPLLKQMKQKQPNLKKLWSYFETIKPQYEIETVRDEPKTPTLESLADQQFIDEHLKKDILLLNTYKEVIIKTDQYTFRLKFYYDKTDNLDDLIETLAYGLSFTILLAPHKVKDITICYYLLGVTRVLDGDTFFDKEEVNGGACWSSPTDCDITVWRKEEILKVSIHELIHGLSYDYKQDTSEIVQHYQAKYGITSPKMNTFEAYTEIFAELIHCYLLARFIYVLHKKRNCYYLFHGFVATEILFSQLQSSKVLSLLELNKDINKETNVTAYYLIKTELYNDLNKFLEFCIKYNEKNIKLKDVSKYLDYLKGLKSVVNKKYNKLSEYLTNTTRMTCLEIELF
jgi:hypothetical protein